MQDLPREIHSIIFRHVAGEMKATMKNRGEMSSIIAHCCAFTMSRVSKYFNAIYNVRGFPPATSAYIAYRAKWYSLGEWLWDHRETSELLLRQIIGVIKSKPPDLRPLCEMITWYADNKSKKYAEQYDMNPVSKIADTMLKFLHYRGAEWIYDNLSCKDCHVSLYLIIASRHDELFRRNIQVRFLRDENDHEVSAIGDPHYLIIMWHHVLENGTTAARDYLWNIKMIRDIVEREYDAYIWRRCALSINAAKWIIANISEIKWTCLSLETAIQRMKPPVFSIMTSRMAHDSFDIHYNASKLSQRAKNNLAMLQRMNLPNIKFIPTDSFSLVINEPNPIET